MKFLSRILLSVSVMLCFMSCVSLPPAENESDTLVLFPVKTKVSGNWFMDGQFEFVITDKNNDHVDSLFFSFTGMNNVHCIHGLEPGSYVLSKVLFNNGSGESFLVMEIPMPFVAEAGKVSSFAYTFTVSIGIDGTVLCDLENPFEGDPPYNAPQIKVLRNEPISFWESWDLGNMGILVRENKLAFVQLDNDMKDIIFTELDL